MTLPRVSQDCDILYATNSQIRPAGPLFEPVDFDRIFATELLNSIGTLTIGSDPMMIPHLETHLRESDPKIWNACQTSPDTLYLRPIRDQLQDSLNSSLISGGGATTSGREEMKRLNHERILRVAAEIMYKKHRIRTQTNCTWLLPSVHFDRSKGFFDGRLCPDDIVYRYDAATMSQPLGDGCPHLLGIFHEKIDLARLRFLVGSTFTNAVWFDNKRGPFLQQCTTTRNLLLRVSPVRVVSEWKLI